jgi:sn-glycerol 3-phosphate transport system substrate-binding protein
MRISRLFVSLTALGLVAACSSGGSITGSGDTTAPKPPATTSGSSSTGSTVAPATTAGPSTTAVPADSFPDCTTDALATASGTTNITFWHGMSGPLNDELTKLTDAYNKSQTKVKVKLVQGSYEDTADNYLQASQNKRPDMVQLPEYMVQSIVDTKSTIPVGKCVKAANFDLSKFLPAGLAAYTTQGMQRSMPFNISNPVLFYNKKAFAKAGLDPNKPPASLDEMRTMSQKIVDSGAAPFGLALESGFDSGGGWYVEQWFAKAQQFYLDNDNGRSARATKVLYNDQTGVDLLTFLQKMINDKLAVNVGDNSTTGYDNLLKLADKKQPAAMTIATSASLGPVLTVLGDATQFPQIGPNDVGVGPMPGPDGKPGALIGGASLWMVDSGDAVRTSATWDYLTYLVAAEQQSEWATATGYIPVRTDAADLEPYKSTIAKDPRFNVAGDQLAASPDAPTSAGPVTGPLREVRSVLANSVAAILGGADVQASLDDAANQANALISDYNSRNPG